MTRQQNCRDPVECPENTEVSGQMHYFCVSSLTLVSPGTERLHVASGDSSVETSGMSIWLSKVFTYSKSKVLSVH